MATPFGELRVRLPRSNRSGACRVHHNDAIVAGIGDVKIARIIARQAFRGAQTSAQSGDGQHRCAAIWRHSDDLIVSGIGDVDISAVVDEDAFRMIESCASGIQNRCHSVEHHRWREPHTAGAHTKRHSKPASRR